MDDQILALIGEKSDLSVPRHVLHYLLFPDEASARAAAEKITAAGWDVSRVSELPSEVSTEFSWSIVAEREKVLVNHESVRMNREFFEAIAAETNGALYDGWEAGL